MIEQKLRDHQGPRTAVQWIHKGEADKVMNSSSMKETSQTSLPPAGFMTIHAPLSLSGASYSTDTKGALSEEATGALVRRGSRTMARLSAGFKTVTANTETAVSMTNAKSRSRSRMCHAAKRQRSEQYGNATMQLAAPCRPD